MSLEPAGNSERVIGTVRQVPESTDKVNATITQKGTAIRVQIDAACRVQAYDRVETTEHFATRNKSPALDWTFGIGGAAFLGLGIWGLADASNAYSTDTSSRTYNPVGSGPEQGLAVASLATGAVFLGIASIDVIRGQHTEKKISAAERRAAIVGSCPSKPLPGIPLAAAMGVATPMAAIPLGITDSEGALDVDLARLLPMPSGDINGEPYGATISIIVGERIVGTASLSAAYAVLHPVWKRARDDAEASAAEGGRLTTKREAEARIQRDEEAVDEFESNLARAEQAVAKLEKTKEPWGKEELALLVPVLEWVNNQPKLSVDDGFAPRVAALSSRVTRLAQKLAPLAPKLKNAIARAQAEADKREAEQQRRYEAERPLREAAERERARDKCERLCNESESSCASSCPNSLSESDARFRCKQSCSASRESCLAGCQR